MSGATFSSKRAAQISRLIQDVPAVSFPNDEYVAKLLSEEASRRKKSYDSIGIAAYTRALPSAAPKEINKTFLANTIRDVDGHNRREEIDDCWRAHRMSSKVGHAGGGEKKRRRHDDENPSSHTSRDEDSRAYWANLKAKKLKTQPISQDGKSSPTLSGQHSQGSDSDGDKLKAKKKKKKHRDNKKARHNDERESGKQHKKKKRKKDTE